jgi:hypothetical protein
MGRGRQGAGRRGCVCGGARAGVWAAVVARWGSKRYELEGQLSTRTRKVAVDAGPAFGTGIRSCPCWVDPQLTQFPKGRALIKEFQRRHYEAYKSGRPI